MGIIVVFWGLVVYGLGFMGVMGGVGGGIGWCCGVGILIGWVGLLGCFGVYYCGCFGCGVLLGGGMLWFIEVFLGCDVLVGCGFVLEFFFIRCRDVYWVGWVVYVVVSYCFDC